MKTILVNMFISVLTLVLTFMLASAVPAQAQDENRLAELRRLIREGDDIGARILAVKWLKSGILHDDWRAGRKLLESRPSVGWDLIVKWNAKRPPSLIPDLDRAESEFHAAFARADQWMIERKFDEAFTLYQELAQRRRGPAKTTGSADLLDLTLYHAMARALYGAGRFGEATDVYQWIHPSYPFLRQVQFEKMWSAFRASRFDIAMGAIGSMHSSYFSSFAEPEAYLVQIYLYRKLCRKDDLRLAIRSMKSFRDSLKSGAYGWREWTRRDLETFALLQMIDSSKAPSSRFISPRERQAEKARLTKTLQKRYEEDRKRLIADLERVAIVTKYALDSKAPDLKTITRLKSQIALDRASLDMWPVDDAEDWLDELGHHVFIGDSKCSRP